MNAGLPESMSDDLDRLQAEPGHTRPNPCTDQHCQPKCAQAQCWEEVGIYRFLHRSDECGTKLFSWAQGRSQETPDGSKKALGPVGIPHKRVPQALGDKPSPFKEG